MSEGENEERERVSDEAARGEAEEATSAHTASASRPGDHDGDQAVNEAELKAQGADADADAGEGAEKHEDGEELTDSQDSFERGSSAELASREAEDAYTPQSHESGAEARAPEEGAANDAEGDDHDSNDSDQHETLDGEIDQDAEGGEDESASLPGDDDEARGPGLEPALHLEPEQRKSVIESVIFVADKPITERQIAQKLGLETEEVRRAVEELVEEYSERGIRLDRISGGLLFRTAAANAPFVRKMKAPPPVRMTRAQLETLSIVAYRQPVTRPEVDEIRGVDSGSALKVLADRELVRILGRKEEPGRPLLYGTTTFFLEFFGLNSLRDLPTLKEFSDLSEESRSLFERRMGEPIDMRAIREEAEAAEAAMQDELLQQFPDNDDENDDVDERDDEAPAEEQDDEREAEEAAPEISPERAIRDSIEDDDDDELDDDELDDDELDDDERDDDEWDELNHDDDDDDDEWDDEDDDDDEWDEDDELDDDERDDGDGAQDKLDDRRDAGQEEQDEQDGLEPPEDDDDLPRDDSASSASLSDDFDDDDFEDDDPDDDVFENPDFDDDEDWEDEEDDDDWEDDDEEDEE